ncbi:response regulator [Rossellomorea vietnamensis]|uniref:Response regulator n=1 Tax=Rossellomorea vietnamensis TaxID=218284 RepID=A0A6I6UPA8_9BACI|nr:response regulator [Rossellomorea vietnamensis]QHE63217.1 response regulator [Rossellomorea vietnamensis]
MTKPIHILLIEDVPMVQEVNRMFIERVPGFTVCAIAGNGQEGAEKVSSYQPDLVLLDNFMPRQTGIETLQAFRQQGTDVDVIVISAAQDKETIRDMMRLGVVDYIIKPFKFERLKQALEKYRAFKQQISGEGVIGQHEIDQLQGGPSSPGPDNHHMDLPKGLNAQTLQQIVQYLSDQSTPLSAEETAEGIGIARVTARRYLDYLLKSDQVQILIEYGGIGRPVNRYQWKNG